LTDIAGRKEAENALFREKDRAHRTLAAIGDGVITTDADGRIELINPAARQFTGWREDQAKGEPLETVFAIRMNGTAPQVGDLFEQCREHGDRSWGEASSWLHCVGGTSLAVEWSMAPTRDAGGELSGCVLVFRDVTDQRSMQRRLTYQANHDLLTGLMNRTALQDVLDREQARATRNNGHFAALLLDIDRFKVINDNYGHSAGDEVLCRFAQRIGGHFRQGDWLGRWGGEEFLAILPETAPDEACAIAERIRAAIEAEPMEVNGLPLFVTASFGVAGYPDCADGGEELLQVADSRLYEAKRTGRNRVVNDHPGSHGILTMAGKLQQALSQDGVAAAYQPMVSLADHSVVAEEALARLVSPEGDTLPAGLFIEAASHLQLVHRIDEQLIETTVQRCAHMMAGHDGMAHFVNISTDLLRHRDRVDHLLDRMRAACESCGTDLPSVKPLVIEITEREFLEDPAEARRVLAPFLDYGFRLAVDDFGSGYSSFRYLADLPVSFLKIEGDLVGRATRDPRIQAIIRGLRDIAGELNLTTIAEKVEDAETTDFLREVGIDWAQGFYFGRPQLAR
ncbi:MAG TPA: EAL domain-containing protein, partial [Gammaproteobacteria bacterium]|nr:EAL domain-containing protein [Gammaproteobacteria bacterium]